MQTETQPQAEPVPDPAELAEALLVGLRQVDPSLLDGLEPALIFLAAPLPGGDAS